MTERPIIMAGESVRAILEGRKTMTRRVMRPQPPATVCTGSPITSVDAPGDNWQLKGYEGTWGFRGANGVALSDVWRCPYGGPGDRLYVKETWAHDCPHCTDIKCGNPDHIWYRASESPIVAESFAGAARWRSSMFMPRWASRLTLEVVTVRVEKLQDISERDCCLEIGAPVEWSGTGPEPYKRDVRGCFARLWNEINGKRGFGWDVNPWVWAIEFNKVQTA